MIVSLFVKNYALIDELYLDLQSGFSVITGETGSGKSIIMGALNLLLGQRNDSRSIKDNTSKCIVEAQFDISSYNLNTYFKTNDLDYDPKTIIRREISPNGKSRAFVNDSPVKLAEIQKLTSRLIDIHSQNENQLLDNGTFQLEVLDAIAKTDNNITAYKRDFAQYKLLAKHLAIEEEKLKKGKQEFDYFQFQHQQLEDAALQADDQIILEKEKELIEHSTDLKEGLTALAQGITEENQGVLSMVQRLRQIASQISNYYEPAKEYSSRLESVYLELQDIGEDTDTKAEDVEYDPLRIQQIEERLDLIYTLQQKHMVDSVEALLILQSEFSNKLLSIELSETNVEQLTTELDSIKETLQKQATEITKKRIAAIPALEKAITAPLGKLGIAHPLFNITHKISEELSADGQDKISFLFSANKNGTPSPIKDVASGGEKSRLMFSIKSLLSKYKSLPSIIFDEIDTGISGEVANQMAIMLRELGKNMQVIVITHLPQVAAKGDTHYKVLKFDHADQTRTDITRLTLDQRIAEIAEMLSGKPPTEAALSNARDLLKL